MSPPQTYADALPKRGPTWFQGPNASLYFAACGGLIDTMVDLVRQAVKVRMPLVAPSDALPWIGQERLIVRSPLDTDASYAVRTQQAWTSWPQAGTAYGILLALADQGYTSANGNPVLVQQNGLGFQLDSQRNLVITTLMADVLAPGGGPWWRYDANNAFWSRFSLVFPGPLPTTPGSGAAWNNVQNPPTALTAPTLAEVNGIRRIGNLWRRAVATWVNIIVVTGGELWGWPVGLWGDPGQWGGSAVTWGTVEQ